MAVETVDERVEPDRYAKPPALKRTPITSGQRQRALAEADAILKRAGRAISRRL